MVQKTTQKKNPGVFSKTIMLQLLDVGRNGIVFQTLNIKQNTMLFFSIIIHGYSFWNHKRGGKIWCEGHFVLLRTILSLPATFSIRDRSVRAIWSRASVTDTLFFKSIPPHPRKHCFERRLILLSIRVGNDPINSVLIHFQLSGY